MAQVKKDLKIAVCGIGYVGLPVALLFAKAGYDVKGVDVDQERVDLINKGVNPIKGREPGMDELLKTVVKKHKFEATTDVEAYRDRDIIMVAVQTPVEDDSHEPRYAHMRAACANIAQHMKRGALVVIESTIAPTTMEKVIKATLEQESGWKVNKDFLLANCPERVMPGRLIYNLTHYDRLVGAYNDKAGQTVKDLYEKVLGVKVDITDPITAEIVKSGENTYRDVQIAFANEMALLCEAYGANVWKVRELINKCPYRAMHLPGAGVGGHCIPKDSYLLIYGAKDLIQTKMIPLARKINDFMPQHMFDLLQMGLHEAGRTYDDTRIVVLGYAYDANSDDTRMTPTDEIMAKLEAEGANFIVHDPFVEQYKDTFENAVKDAGAIILMTAHEQYQKTSLNKLKELMKGRKPVIIDGRNVYDKEKAEKLGFVYRGVGNI